MTSHLSLRPDYKGSVTLYLDRPAKRNALSVEMWAAIPALIEEAIANPDVSLIFVRGAGGAFASGADISEMPIVYADAQAALANDEKIQGAMTALEVCPKPVIALIEGPCVGGGCGIALACDMRFGVVGSRYGVTPAKLGLVYGAADTRRLVQAIGLSKAKDILFTGRLLEGEEALAIGLIDRLILPENIDDVAADYAHLIVRASRYSIRAQKAIFDLLRGGADDAPESRALFGASFEGADFKEGLEAFMQKRPAKFPVR